MQNSTSFASHVERNESRLSIEIEAIVRVKEQDGDGWKEIAVLTSVSRNGAGFSLPRPCDVGTLVGLVLPMPPKLRVHDRSKELYPIFGLVQYCHPSNSLGEAGYDIGVAFIGKKPPESYDRNPAQNYKITGMAKNALWTISESGTTFIPRKHPRYTMPLDVGVSLLQKETRSIVKNTGTTRDLSIGGASVKCQLDASIGDKVKFACEKLDFYSIAVVRNLESSEGDDNLLRLEFLESEFPVDKLHLVRETKKEAAPTEEVEMDVDELEESSDTSVNFEVVDDNEVV